jgi:hypothetical protein
MCFVIYIAGFFFEIFFCYEVFAKQKKTERSTNHYSLKSITMCSMQNDIARQPWDTNMLRLVTFTLITKETLFIATEIPSSTVIAAVDLLAHTLQKGVLLLCGLEL